MTSIPEKVRVILREVEKDRKRGNSMAFVLWQSAPQILPALRFSVSDWKPGEVNRSVKSYSTLFRNWELYSEHFKSSDGRMHVLKTPLILFPQYCKRSSQSRQGYVGDSNSSRSAAKHLRYDVQFAQTNACRCKAAPEMHPPPVNVTSIGSFTIL